MPVLLTCQHNTAQTGTIQQLSQLAINQHHEWFVDTVHMAPYWYVGLPKTQKLIVLNADQLIMTNLPLITIPSMDLVFQTQRTTNTHKTATTIFRRFP